MTTPAGGGAGWYRFDTAGLADDARPAAIAAGLVADCGHSRVTHLCPRELVWARWRCTRLSASIRIIRYDGSAVRVTRRARDVADHPTPWMLFAVPGTAGGTFRQGGSTRRLSSDELVLVDAGAPYDYRSAEGGRSAVRVAATALPVGAEDIRAAAPLLRHSPLHDLVRDHICSLAGMVDPPADTHTRDDVDRATSLLLLALLVSCGASLTPPRDV